MQKPILAVVMLALISYMPAAAQESTITPPSTSVTPLVLEAKLPKPGSGLAYDLSIDGTVTITQPTTTQKPDVQKQDILIAAGLELRWEAKKSDGSWPAKINLVAPRIKAGGKELPIDQEATAAMTAKFDSNGQLLSVQTPSVINSLGIDITHALLGLTIPMPAGSASVGASWVVRSSISGPGKGFDLRTTYTLVSFAERRGKRLANVRGSMTFTPRDGSNRLNYVGYLEAYVDPATGRIVESGTSFDVSGKISLPSPKTGLPEEATVRTVITAYLLDLGPASATPPAPPQAPAKPVTPKAPTVPSATVGQQPEPFNAQQGTTLNSGSSDLPPGADAPQPVPPVERITSAYETNTAYSELAPTTGADDKAAGTDQTDLGVAAWQPGYTYADPAGRFQLTLPAGWQASYQQISADTTAFAGPEAPQMIYVFVGPSGGEALAEYARNVLAKYARSASPRFKLISNLAETKLAGTPALAVHYTYPGPTPGSEIGEISVFARYGDQNYIIQYTDTPQRLAAESQVVMQYLGTALRCGETPSGIVPTALLTSGIWNTYTDPQRRFTVDVPEIWPLFSYSADGSNTTFAELGKKGYLTVYSQPQVGNYGADSVLAAWREQWSRQEKGYVELVPLRPVLLGGMPGAELSYRWINADGKEWQRRLQAAVRDGMLYVVTIDYVAAQATERNPVFDRLFTSFQFITNASFSMVSPTESSSALPALANMIAAVTAPTSPQSGGVVSGAGHVSVASPIRLEDPLDSNRVLLAGRIGLRQGQEVKWLSGVVLRIKAGQALYATRTDANGYFAFANIAPLSHGQYELADADGLLPGYREPVTISFSGVLLPTAVGKYINAGYVLMDTQANGTISVACLLPQALPDPHDTTRHILSIHPNGGWAPALSAALNSR